MISKTNPNAFCAYIDAGMMLFPCQQYTKIPSRKGFLDLPFDPDFEPQDQNYGVLLRNRYLVIDCDTRHYNKDDKPLTRLLTDLELPLDLFKQTFTVETPSKGYHVYLTKPEDVLLVNSLKEYPGLEFKTKFIMACGSYIDKTPKGEPVERGYRAIFNSPKNILPCPHALLVRLKKTDAPIITLAEPVEPDNASDVFAFTQHCQMVEPAIEGRNGDLRTFQVACAGREFGLSQEKTLEIMKTIFNPRCEPVWDEEALALKVSNAYEYSTRTPQGVKSIQNQFTTVESPKTETKIKYQLDSHGQIKKNFFNLRQIFNFPTIHQNKDDKKILTIPPIGNYLKYDQFVHDIVWDKPAPWFKISNEWTDQDAVEFKNILSEQLAMDFSVDLIHEVASVCASRRAFHPVRDYLNDCSWDGIRRVDRWLSMYCGAVDNSYTRFIGRKALIACVARIFNPGVKFDHVLVMEGVQGIGKSYMWDVLANPWFTDAPLHIQDKSAIEIMRGKWIVELAEMDALTKYESQTIKGFLSRTEDRCRMAYERKTQNFPRQNVFVGSLNPEVHGWLKDRTGNRRYWPVAVSRIDIPELKRVRHELWAEALELYKKGEDLSVADANMRSLMAQEVEGRMQQDPWFSILEEHLHSKANDYMTEQGIVVNPAEMYSRCIGGSASTFRFQESGRIASILHSLGFEKVRGEGKIGYVYVKKLIEEVL